MEREFRLLKKEKWDEALKKLLPVFSVYAPLQQNGHLDYEHLTERDIPDIIYNRAKPVSPLKLFFLPVREELTRPDDTGTKVIIGVPSCDLAALDLLDKIYLEGEIPDPVYRQNRQNTILIGSDCFEIQKHCHCTSYGVNPYPEKNHDLTLNITGNNVVFHINTETGRGFLDEMAAIVPQDTVEEDYPEGISRNREKVKQYLTEKNSDLPDYQSTGLLIDKSDKAVWEEYATDCVSCGACAAICPTCTCFLLTDKTGFRKVRNLDTCQYPAFEKVAAGGDPLREKTTRFKNRYLCKYVWKPAVYETTACTGCGRCIEACIGKINKNELFRELVGSLVK